jgi:pyruvate dehydrogenase E1 component alpha subunit
MTNSLTAELGILADPTQLTEPLNIEGCNPELLISQLKRMILIRRVEETIADMVETGEARCPCHLAIGQEATAVAVAAHLTPKDKIFGCHRSHAHYLALGGDPYTLFAEVLGRVTGCAGGMGGSMHLYDPAHGLLGTVPIVAATIPIATGAALAAKMDNGTDIAIAFFGDGATEEGVFHESLNLASVMGLPIIFVCENNLFSSHLHISLRQPYNSITRYAVAHGISAKVVDGNDVVAISRAASELVQQARDNRQPAMLETVTYRWRGHVGHREDLDVGVKRSEELILWKQRDPIRRLAQALENQSFFNAQALTAMRDEVDSLTTKALEEARKAPYPADSQLLDCVYSHNLHHPFHPAGI